MQEDQIERHIVPAVPADVASAAFSLDALMVAVIHRKSKYPTFPIHFTRLYRFPRGYCF